MTVAHHVFLPAPGASAASIQRFYGDGLGLTLLQKPESLAHVPVFWFDAGPLTLHVGSPEGGVAGTGHVALATENLDDVRARLRSLGYRIDDNVIPMGYPRFYVHDPWGNQFELLPCPLRE